MYPKNTASPRPIYAKVINASTGDPITTGVTAFHIQGTTRSAAINAPTHINSGTWAYTPTQDETNYDAFAIEFYHVDAVGDGPLVEIITNDGVTLANGAHGGSAATLQLKSVDVTNTTGTAVKFESSDGHGLHVVGGDWGSGLYAAGGTTGSGVYTLGGSTSGAGLMAIGQGANDSGISASGPTAGLNASSANGAGALFEGKTNGTGLTIKGAGTGHGLVAESGTGATGNAVHIEAKSTNGNGLYSLGAGTGAGLRAQGSNGIIGYATGATGSGLMP